MMRLLDFNRWCDFLYITCLIFHIFTHSTENYKHSNIHCVVNSSYCLQQSRGSRGSTIPMKIQILKEN